MSQTQRISSNNTTVSDDGNGMMQVILHSTPIVKWNEKVIILNSGGYQTHTTKTRMTQTTNQMNLGFVVYQKDFDWFVDFKGKTVEFHDGMELTR